MHGQVLHAWPIYVLPLTGSAYPPLCPANPIPDHSGNPATLPPSFITHTSSITAIVYDIMLGPVGVSIRAVTIGCLKGGYYISLNETCTYDTGVVGRPWQCRSGKHLTSRPARIHKLT